MGDVVIVSTSDIDRGPMLCGFVRERLRKLAPGATCVSRGVNVVAPSRASQQSVTVMKSDFGIDIGGHIARALSAEDLRECVTVVCVSSEHERYLTAVYPDFASKVSLIGTAAAEGAEPVTGEDPLPYQMCAAHLRECAERLDITRVLAKGAPIC